VSGYHLASLGPAGRPSFHTRVGPGKSSAGVGRAKKNQVMFVQRYLNLLLTLLKL
jgi:hypothetical protein